jgi:hypothetical protein
VGKAGLSSPQGRKPPVITVASTLAAKPGSLSAAHNDKGVSSRNSFSPSLITKNYLSNGQTGL